MRKYTNIINRLLMLLCLVALPSVIAAQDLQVKEPLHVSPFDIITSDMAVNDYNNVPCALVKVQLPIPGATFQGNIFKSEFKTNEYWVWMTNGTKKFRIRCPGFQTLEVDVLKTVPEGLKSNVCYAILLVAPTNNGSTNVDDGMRYLVINVSPANATVAVDGKLQTVQDGSASVLLPIGPHTYRVEAMGYSSKTATVEMTGEKKVIDVSLESTMAQLTVSCPTTGANIYVNDRLKGTAPWTGKLAEGNYQIEARREGYRPQRQSVVLAEREQRNVELPALTAITGNIDVNYKPVNAEVWIDGKKAGNSPDVFRDLLVGNHSVEIRANGYISNKKTITISEGQTTQLSGSLTSNATVSSSNAITSSSNAITSPSNATVPVPEAVDLGLSVKWASFNLGASKPEETGNYYKWGETKPSDTGGWSTYKYAKGSKTTLTKYCSYASYGYNGFTDGKTKLEPMDDAATVNLGGKWRMPTEGEIKELINRCERKRTTENGIKGIRVTGPNGNSIFFPAAGSRSYLDGSIFDVGSSGWYWSAASNFSCHSYNFNFFYSGKWEGSANQRASGFPIRPVLAE